MTHFRNLGGDPTTLVADLSPWQNKNKKAQKVGHGAHGFVISHDEPLKQKKQEREGLDENIEKSRKKFCSSELPTCFP